MEDVARQAGVALSTVSRALNNDPRISALTRQRIHKIADDLGFYKNRLASSLMTNRTNIIGVIIPQINRAFFSSVIYSMEETADQLGYSLLICQSRDEWAREKEKVETLLSLNVDGIVASIAIGSKDFNHFIKAKELGTPLLFFDRIPNIQFPVNTIRINDFKSAYEGTLHLINQGYQRIAHLAGPTQLHIFEQRKQGYLKALQDHNLPILQEYIIEHHLMSLTDGQNSTRTLLQNPNPPDAIFCANNLMAISAATIAAEKGFQVPQDLGIIGFSEEPSAAVMRPGITSIRQPAVEIGKLAIEKIIDEINLLVKKEKPDFEEIILPTQLKIRQSSTRLNS